MHLYCYENENLNKIIDDGIRDFCLCERVNEERMRSLIKRACGVGGIMKTERIGTMVKRLKMRSYRFC